MIHRVAAALGLAALFPASMRAQALAVSPPSVAELKLSLDDFAALALKQSLRYQTYRNSLESETLGWRAAYRSLRAPLFNVSATAGRTFAATSVTRSYTNATSQSLSLTQPVYFSGGDLAVSGTRNTSRVDSAGAISAVRTEPSVSVAYTQPLFLFVGDPRRRTWLRTEIGNKTALAALDREGLAIWVDARKLYYQNVQKEFEMATEQKTLDSSRAVLRTVRALVDAGKNAPVDVSRSEVRYQRDMRRIQNAQIALAQTRNETVNFLQLPPDTRMILTTPLKYEPFKRDLDELLRFALLHRQDYLNAQRALQLAELTLKDREEQNRVRLSLSGGYTTEKTVPNVGLDNYGHGWTVAGTLTKPLFDSGVNRLQVAQERKTLENARISLDNTRRALELELRNAYLDVKRLEEQIGEFEENRRQVERNLKAVRYRYSNGIDRLIDLFDAENELRALELEYVGLLVSYHTSRDQLSLTIGARWEDIP